MQVEESGGVPDHVETKLCSDRSTDDATVVAVDGINDAGDEDDCR